ncbi:GAF domain-containing protein [Nocardioides sp.]|uniref:GAF domain-containing protein n=1 Tax=Nocardioides sp. TaxID=35761 RepID=UPI001A2C572E|nr:GAF domain-containing protein [Nocardioides sp.]MBJ7358839.1 GAF domain-containing protein [Nocardioides sp.]
MEPIPESVEAMRERDAVMEDDDLLDRLRAVSTEVQELVPDCIGMSIAILEDELALTLVATEPEIAVLDALQYLGDGPCLEAVREGAVVELNDEDLLDEERWRIFALAGASGVVASTLTLPIVREEEVVGSVNLYAASGHAFSGHHEQLAQMLGGWAPGAIENADLTFSTRLRAEQAPAHQRARARMDTAVGLLAAYAGLSADTARSRLEASAARAGVAPSRIAHAVITLFGGEP